MKWPLFENKVKEELSAHRSEVDVDALWGAIEPEVDAINASHHKKRRVVWWILLAGVLVAGSMAGYFWGYGQDGADEVEALHIAINENENIVKDLNEATLETTDQDVISNNQDFDFPSEPQVGTNLATIKSDSGSAIKQAEALKERDGLKRNLIRRSGSDHKNTQIVENKGLIGFANEAESKVIRQAIMEEVKGEMDRPAESAVVFRNPNLPTVPFLPVRVDLRQRLSVPAVLLPVSTKSGLNEVAPTKTEEPRHPMARKQFRFALGLNGGFSYAQRTLSDGGDPTFRELIKLREKTEKSLETSHLGLQLTARHQSGFSLTTGLQYTRIVELYERNETVVKNDSIDGILYYAVIPDNDTIPVMGMVPHTTTTEFRTKIYNRYTLFDIPVIVGYHRESDRWAWGIQAGVFANLSLTAEGRFPKSEVEDQDIKDVFRSSVGLSYYASLSAGYQLNDDLEIALSPYLRYFPKNFAEIAQPSQKYTLLGLDARFRYWF